MCYLYYVFYVGRVYVSSWRHSQHFAFCGRLASRLALGPESSTSTTIFASCGSNFYSCRSTHNTEHAQRIATLIRLHIGRFGKVGITCRLVTARGAAVYLYRFVNKPATNEQSDCGARIYCINVLISLRRIECVQCATVFFLNATAPTPE